MESINQETIEFILNEKYTEDFWVFELGRAEGTSISDTQVEHYFMNSFFERGENLWKSHKEKLKTLLCDSESKQPKELIQELISGNIKDLIVNIITTLTTTYSLSLAVAIPLCAILLKKGINTICS